MKQLQKILLNMDAAVESQHALQAAIKLSRLSGATIVAVNVVNHHVVTSLARHSGRSLAEIEVELEEDGWRYLYTAEEEGKNAGARIVLMQERGYPEEILPRLAAKFQADLIVIGQSPRMRSDVPCSRIVEQMLEHTPCSLLIVR